MRSRELTLLALLLAATAAGSVERSGGGTPGGLFQLGGGGSKEPITVTADRLEYDYKSNVLVYRGSVEAVQGKATLHSDVLTVTFLRDEAKDGAKPSVDPTEGGTSKLQEIVAVGNVRIDQGTRWATGGRAVFDQVRRTVVMSENPMLHDGPNEVAGDRVVVFLDEDRSVVEGGRKRVKAVFHPDSGKGDESTAKTGGPTDGAQRAPDAEAPPRGATPQ